MASILKVADRWRAQVRTAGKSTARTFDTKAEAVAWAAEVETGIRHGVATTATGRVDQVIAAYRKLRLDSGRPVEPEGNEHYMLTHLVEDLGTEQVGKLTSNRLVKWAQDRREQGAGPYTVNMELSKLGTVLRHVASFQGITFPDVVGQARPLMHHLQLIGGGNRRVRRPDADELTRVLEHFADRPMYQDIVRVLAITGLRRGELLRMQWADLDTAQRAVLVRQRKHPRRALARDELVPLLGDAWDIVNRQPKGEGPIFPLHPNTLSKAFCDACRDLGIPDLRLHDLRREAASTLREMGFDTDERKAITGHRSDAIHERYIAVRPADLHAKFDAATTKRKRKPRKSTAASAA